MVTIQLPDELVKKLQTHGVANVEAFVTTMIQQLDDAEINATYQQITEQDINIEKRITALQAAFNEFRSGITPEEWIAVSKAMNEEYVESDETPAGDEDLPEIKD
jgi:hypothetical protein